MKYKYHHLTTFLLAIAMAMGTFSLGITQVEVSHRGDWFYIEPGTDVYIKGSLISTVGNNDPLSNLGGMYISDSVACYGNNLIYGPTPDTITANIFLNGDALQTFTGSTNMRFGNLYIQNTYDSLRLENNVEVYNFMQIDSGNIDLNASTLDLLNIGEIIGENNDRRIFSGPYGRIHLNRPLLSGQTYSDIAGTGFGLQIDGNLGTNVDIWRGNYPQPNVSNGSIERYYFFNPQFNGAVSAPQSKYWDANEFAGNNEAAFRFYLSSTAGVNWGLAGGTVDTVANTMNSDTSLSWILTSNSGLTIAESECDSLPFIEFPEDTVAICGVGGQAWLVPNGIIGNISSWSNGTPNQDSIQVSTPGVYSVTITDLKGCPNQDSVVVVVAPVPVADFDVTPNCIGDTTFFQNQSTLAAGSLSYFWDLNDLFTTAVDTTAATDPTLIYTNPGSFSAILTATSERGCSDTTVETVVILPYPVADFTVQNHCADSTLILVNNSSVTPSAGITYNWDFGNGDSSAAVQPTYAYPGIGVQTITLEATSNGCTSSLNQSVTIHPNPVAAFTSNQACFGTATNFTNTSSLSAGSLTYLWNLASTVNSTLNNPTYVYPSDGMQTVTLEATSDQGCVDDTTVSVQVNSLPQPSFTALPTCQGDVMAFNNNGPATASYQWDFNGEGQSNGYSPGFAFATSGVKNIVLVATDLNGCTDSIAQQVDAKPTPVAGFTVNGNCEGAVISFLNTSTTPFGSMTYQWDFGDQNTATQAAPTHVYSADATYQVELVAENNGCFDTLSLPVTIDSIPLLNLGGAITTCDTQYVFDAQNPGSTYLWSNSSMAQTITAVYNGAYWVTVINPEGCSVSDTVQLTLNSIVSPQLGADSTFCNQAVLDAGYPGATYNWSTGATSQALTVTTTGLYWVEVTDQNGCVGRDSIQVTVVPAVVPNLGPDLDLCDGIVQTLDPTNAGVSYLWSSGATSATLDVTQTGVYWIDLEDTNGCIERDSILVTFNPNPVLDLGADGLYCDSVAYDLSQPNVSYLWNDGSTQPIQVLNATGQYDVLLTDNNTGCESHDTITITISSTPLVSLGGDTTLCSGASLLLDAGNPGETYVWNVGGIQQTQLASSTGLYEVAVTNTDGCTGTDSIFVTVGAPLNTYLGPDFTLCQGQNQTVVSPITGGTYVWALDGLTLSNTAQDLIISDFGAYSVIVTDSNGCAATDTIQALETGSAINADFLVSTISLFAGDTLQFVNLSYPGTFTSYWSFGDGAFSIDEDPQHTYFAPGDYVATLQVDNGVCSSILSKTLTIVPKVIEQPADPVEILINDFAHTLLYPNPNTGSFTVEVDLLKEGDLHITCIDMQGRILFREDMTGKNFQLEYENLNLAVGMYLLNLRVSERSETIKFIKR